MSTVIRALLVEDNEEISFLVQAILANVPGRRFEVAWADSLGAAHARLAAGKFDVIVLDLSLPDSQGLETFRRVRNACGNVPIVILTGTDDEATALTAVAEGAEDFLTKTQWQPESFARTLLFAMERNRNRAARAPAKKGLVFAFLGAKGGVGTTTAVLNIAGALRSADKTCIALEWRTDRGTFAVHLAHKPTRNLASVRELSPATIAAAGIDSILVDAYPNLRVVHGPQDPSEFGDIPLDVAEAVLDAATLAADYVVLDLGASASPLAQLGASKAAFTIVVLDREPITAEAARGALPLLRSWGLGDSCVAGLIMNRAALTHGVQPRDLKTALGCELIGTVPLDACPSPCFEKGVPLTIRRADNFAAASLIEIARRLATGSKTPA